MPRNREITFLVEEKLRELAVRAAHEQGMSLSSYCRDFIIKDLLDKHLIQPDDLLSILSSVKFRQRKVREGEA